jgi:Fe-S cluster biogenesis protein NfuA
MRIRALWQLDVLKRNIRNLFIQTESTPNENSLKFKPGQPVTGSTKVLEFLDPNSARRSSELADDIFRLSGVRGVMFGSDFITVTKTPEVKWTQLKPSIYAAIMDFLSTGRPLIKESPPELEQKEVDYRQEDHEVVMMVKEILDTRIRPTVQEDGGDVQFVSYHDGIVSLQLKGACRSCSSSVVTLKHGIENMLMHYIPEVKEVRQVEDPLETSSEEYFQQVEHDKKNQSEGK